MKKNLNRRDFIKTGSLLGTAVLIGGPLAGNLLSSPIGQDLKFASVESKDRLRCTYKAVELVGGMGKFVTKGAKVGLLINAPSWWRKKGSFVHPDVVLAVVKMCFESGAAEVQYLIDPPGTYFDISKLKDKYSEQIKSIKGCSGNFVSKEIPRAKSLKKVEIIKEVFECDTFINVPIFKHHVGTNMSGCLKNMMGLNTSSTNKYFHNGSGSKGGYDDVNFLSQCIVDLNTLRKPDLCVMDATEFLGTGGPAGPGLIMTANRVIAGTDPVAIDSYSSAFLKHKPGEITMVRMAHERKLGDYNYKKQNYKELTI
ncbi:MAG: DUF362 domain-containing protein [Candidatus Aminicenantes bacterium]|nr:DUF362 domain-containing protein [Candidatus Aminicenantes bacterium]MCK5003551.1 DUF362 domain-containing protein [Candidatus Aminicenantes bacterium]